MKKLAFAVVMGIIASSASADIWSNGSVVTHLVLVPVEMTSARST